MALLIKGLSMPRDCWHCPCNDDAYRCGATGVVFGDTEVDPDRERMKDCPIIFVPDYDNMVICDYKSMRCWDSEGNEMAMQRKVKRRRWYD